MDSYAKAFRNNIWKYNSALAFTSVKYTVDDYTYDATGSIQCFQRHGELFHLQRPLQARDLASSSIECFQIYGKLFHLQGPLQARELTSGQFAQLYFYDPELATNI